MENPTHLNPLLQSRYGIDLPVDLYRFKSSYCNIFLLVRDGKALLVDAGKKGKGKAFLKFLSGLNLKPEDVKYILLTHTHSDHTGALKEIKSKCKSPVVVHRNEADNLQAGYTRAPLGTGLFTSFISYMGRNIATFSLRYPPVNPEIILDTDPLDTEYWHVEWLFTPGHTAGSVSYLIDGKVALPGDTLFGIRKNDCLPAFADNMEELVKSWALLLKSDVRVFFPAHGDLVTREVLERTYQKYTTG